MKPKIQMKLKVLMKLNLMGHLETGEIKEGCSPGCKSEKLRFLPYG